MPHLQFLKIQTLLTPSLPLCPQGLPMVQHGPLSSSHRKGSLCSPAGRSAPAPSHQQHRQASRSVHEHLTAAWTPRPPALAPPHPPPRAPDPVQAGSRLADSPQSSSSWKTPFPARCPPELRLLLDPDRPRPPQAPSARCHAVASVPHAAQSPGLSHTLWLPAPDARGPPCGVPRAAAQARTGDSEMPPAPSSSAGLERADDNPTHGFQPRSAGLM